MKIVPMIGICTVLIAMGSASFANKTIRNADEPANLPPKEFSGLQFVDNRGCVYVRSGYNGRVTWIPRVDRKRRHMCDKKLTPTFAIAARGDETDTGSAAKKAGEKNPITLLREQLGTKAETPAPAAPTAPVGAVTDQSERPLARLIERVRKPVPAVRKPDVAVAVVDPAPAAVAVVDPAPVAVAKPAPVRVVTQEPRKKKAKRIKSGNYVRIARFEDAAESQSAADLFKGSGYKVAVEEDGSLLVGPFRSEGSAKPALAQARGSGFPRASIVSR